MSYVFTIVIRYFMIVHTNSRVLFNVHLVNENDICDVVTVHVVKNHSVYSLCIVV
jgi:hypothetical protein